jgi:hypothetical protein
MLYFPGTARAGVLRSITLFDTRGGHDSKALTI